MEQLCLPAPYGWCAWDGACITLTCDEMPCEQALTTVLLQYSCYPPAIPRILSCLRHSGRYDCILQQSWFKHQQKLVTRDLGDLGVRLYFRGWLKDVRGRL